jgi:hypothetical protein
MSDLNNINNNNFPNGRPDLSRFRIDDAISNRLGNRRNDNRFSEFSDDTMVNSRNKTRFIPKRVYDLKIEKEVHGREYWQQI